MYYKVPSGKDPSKRSSMKSLQIITLAILGIILSGCDRHEQDTIPVSENSNLVLLQDIIADQEAENPIKPGTKYYYSKKTCIKENGELVPNQAEYCSQYNEFVCHFSSDSGRPNAVIREGSLFKIKAIRRYFGYDAWTKSPYTQFIVDVENKNSLDPNEVHFTGFSCISNGITYEPVSLEKVQSQVQKLFKLSI